MNEIRIETSAASGNRRPWQARVYRGETFIGKTGFCASEARAREEGEKIAAARREAEELVARAEGLLREAEEREAKAAGRIAGDESGADRPESFGR